MKTTQTEINGQISICIDDENGNLIWMTEQAHADYLAAQVEHLTEIVPSE